MVYCRLIKGGWIGDDKQQNYTLVCHDKNMKPEFLEYFSFKGIGKYQNYNEKELHRLAEFINELLIENKQLKEEKDIILNLQGGILD